MTNMKKKGQKKNLLTSVIKTSDRTNEMVFNILPSTSFFERLSKTSNELKRAVVIPIHGLRSDRNVEIISVQPGSLWSEIAPGCIVALIVVGFVCWVATVIRKKRAEAKIMEHHAKTLNLKNNALLVLIEAQKNQLSNILLAEVQAIQSNHYSHNDPEAMERLKLSLNAMADLIDRGTKVIPSSAEDTFFPNCNKLNQIESVVKQITQ